MDGSTLFFHAGSSMWKRARVLVFLNYISAQTLDARVIRPQSEITDSKWFIELCYKRSEESFFTNNIQIIGR